MNYFLEKAKPSHYCYDIVRKIHFCYQTIFSVHLWQKKERFSRGRIVIRSVDTAFHVTFNNTGGLTTSKGWGTERILYAVEGKLGKVSYERVFLRVLLCEFISVLDTDDLWARRRQTMDINPGINSFFWKVSIVSVPDYGLPYPLLLLEICR